MCSTQFIQSGDRAPRKGDYIIAFSATSDIRAGAYSCYFITIRNFSTFFSEQLQSARSFHIHILSSIQLRPRTSETILPCFNSNYHFQILASCKTNQYREAGCCAINSTAAISFPTLWFYYVYLYESLTVLH